MKNRIATIWVKFLSIRVLVLPMGFLFAMLWAYGLSAQNIPIPACGTIKRMENFPSKYIQARNVDIWLPQGYSSSRKYAVLYMHDGQMLFDSTHTWNHQEWGVDETLCSLLSSHTLKDCIVVGIWNSNQRHSEYFPQKPFSSLNADEQKKILDIGKAQSSPLLGAGPVSDNYLKFLVQELKPYIDAHYASRPERNHTFVAGSSMGGLISLYAICEYPEVFGGAACMSTHWPGTFTTKDNPIPGSFLQYLKDKAPSPKNHKLYFDRGTKTLDSLYGPFQVKADSILRKAGYTASNFLSKEFIGDDHSERSWSRRLRDPLIFLLK